MVGAALRAALRTAHSAAFRATRADCAAAGARPAHRAALHPPDAHTARLVRTSCTDITRYFNLDSLTRYHAPGTVHRYLALN